MHSSEEYIALMSEDKLYVIFWLLKILRLSHIKAIRNTLTRVKDMLAEYFYTKKYTLELLLPWMMAGLRFLLCVHFLTCAWLLVKNFKRVELDDQTEFFTDYESKTSMYVDSVYMIVSTISTVGYGDFKAFVDTEGGWTAEMIFLIFGIVIGILLFASVTNEIFSYRKLLTVQQLVEKHVTEVEIYLYEISSTRKGVNLPMAIINECKDHMELSILDATSYHFA